VKVLYKEELKPKRYSTIEAWAVARQVADMGVIGEWHGPRINFNDDGRILGGHYLSGVGWRVLTGPAYELNRWYHIALVRDNLTHYLYVDGIEVASATIEDADTDYASLAYNIGALTDSGSDAPYGDYLDGIIASVRIYNRALTQAEIRHNMFRWGSPIKDGLVLWLSETSINPPIWNDLSGYGNDGTIYGATKMERARPAIKVDPAERVLAAVR